MRIIIYNSSSFGGCFDYGKALLNAYQKHKDVERVSWWVPENAELKEFDSVRRLFVSDKPQLKSQILKQFHFLLRTVMNPLLLLKRLSVQPPSVVIFNDFEQLSAGLWVPLFRWILGKKHMFVIVLHDPDRDDYPPSLSFTNWSMKTMMTLMDVAVFHDFLPEKIYYRNLPECIFLDLPHGYYAMPAPDQKLLAELRKLESPERTILTIPGNIREEKNYDLAIEAISSLPEYILIIAGSASNARVNIQQYKNLAAKLGVSDRVIWIEKFLTEAELSAVIEICDVVVLNYAVSFTSQSGILNVVAPFRKELIVSDGPSSLASVLKKFKVGELVKPGSVDSLIEGLKKLSVEEAEVRDNWDDYLSYASWENHVNKAMECYSKIKQMAS
jgi:glycosyltransferase involved in cell wall biosynthesis